MSTKASAHHGPGPHDSKSDSLVMPSAEVEEDILRMVRSLEYGSVEITVHDSRVVQVERREKLRFDAGSKCKRG